METNKFKNINPVGLSRDLRTNRWKITCKSCNKTFEPATTMLAKQVVECPKCFNTETINYNKYKQNQ